MPGNQQVLSGTGAGDEKQAPLALDVEIMRALIIGGRGDGGRRWHLVLANADHGDTAKLQPFHPVHGRDCHFTVPRGTLC